MINFTGSDEAYYAPMKRLCEETKKLNVPLELNMLGVWEKRIYPCERFFRIAGEVGNDVILGIDAHQPHVIRDEQPYLDALTLCQEWGLMPEMHIELRDIR
jgi:histidinol-phosphatase (PHP family)